MVLTMKFLVVESSPITILIPLEPKYSHRDPIFKYLFSLHSYLNVRDNVSQSYSTTSNIIVLYILIFKFFRRNGKDKGIWTE